MFQEKYQEGIACENRHDDDDNDDGDNDDDDDGDDDDGGDDDDDDDDIQTLLGHNVSSDFPARNCRRISRTRCREYIRLPLSRI